MRGPQNRIFESLTRSVTPAIRSANDSTEQRRLTVRRIFAGGVPSFDARRKVNRLLPSWPPQWTPAGLFLTAGLFRAAQNSGQTTFPLLARNDIGASAGTIGALGTTAGVVMVLAASVLATKLATRRATSVIAAGSAILAVGLFVIGSTVSLIQLTAGLVFLGIAGGIAPSSLATAIGGAGRVQRERQLAIYATVLSASLAIGPVLEAATLYVAHQDVRIALFAFAPLPVLALAVGLRTGHKGTPGPNHLSVNEKPSPPVGPTAPAPAAQAKLELPSDTAKSQEPKEKRPGRTVLLGTPAGRIALIMQLLYTVPFAMVTVFGALLARNVFGLTAAHSQLGFTALFVTSLASRVAVVRRSPIEAKLPLFAACVALTIAGLTLLALGGQPVVFYVAMALLGVPHGVIFPLALSLVASSARDGQLAAANAGLFATVSLVSAMAPAILGSIASAFDYRIMAAAVIAPVLIFTMLLLAQWRRMTALHT